MYYVIVNPAAGNGRGLKMAERIKRLMDNAEKEYKILYTKASAEAEELAVSACMEGGEGIIGIGGDGTVQEIVSGMFSHGGDKACMPLGILPCGSGNDFVMSLGVSKKDMRNDEHNAVNIIRNMQENKTRLIDIIRVNGKAYLNIANIGLDASIVHNAEKYKKRFKQNAYLAATVQTIARHKNIHMQIDINNTRLKDEFTLIAVCNGQYYGGGMRISPRAAIDDGIITVCLVRCKTRPKLMLLFPTILAEMHTRLKEVQYINCKRLTITLKSEQTLCMDGNLFEKTGELNFEAVPRALHIFG